jgi:uncharacterized protein
MRDMPCILHSMTERSTDPRRLDLRRFAQHADSAEGQWPQAGFERLSGSVLPLAGEAPQVQWQLRGELRPVKGSEPQVWLHLQADTAVQLTCQRCLQAMVEQLAVDRSFLFVPSAEEAERLDEESEDDVLVLPRQFDAIELLEDELILALPLVPRHEACPNPLPVPVDTLDVEVAPNPFAALAALRQTPRQG